MSYPRVLTVQDISCVGQCSLTVALPILSACGAETVILPSAVLSTHTGGFKGYTFRDLSEDLPAIEAHWKQEGIRFDAIYTGYLGSISQISMVREMMATLGKETCLRVVDPAMADNGKLYVGFDMDYAAAMRELAFSADVLLPNVTEACLLTGMEYRETVDEGYVRELTQALAALGAPCVVLTGVGYRPGETGVCVCEQGEIWHYPHRRISKGCHGTGDVYASAFVGAMVQGKSAREAAKIAADYTVACIENTVGDPEHWYGVKFETALPELIRQVR